MKKTLLALLVLISFSASAQIDSTQIKASLNLEVRDWLYVSDGIKHRDQFERLYDSLKARVHTVVNPQSTVKAKIDSIPVGNLIEIARALRSRPYGVSFPVFTRINTAIRAVNNSYLQNQLDLIDDQYGDAYDKVLSGELDRLKRVRQ